MEINFNVVVVGVVAVVAPVTVNKEQKGIIELLKWLEMVPILFSNKVSVSDPIDVKF